MINSKQIIQEFARARASGEKPSAVEWSNRLECAPRTVKLLANSSGFSDVVADYSGMPAEAFKSVFSDAQQKPRSSVEEIKQAMATLPPRTIRKWASLFRISESTIHRIIKKHRIPVRTPPTKKDEIITRLTEAVARGIKKTAEDWGAELGVCPTYVSTTAEMSNLSTAVGRNWARLEGTLSVTPIRGEKLGDGDYSRVLISGRMLELAGLRGEVEVRFRIDPEKKQITIQREGGTL